MGLYVHSLAEIPNSAKRSYYLYLLDYGWSEPLSEALYSNIERMADIASKNDAVVIRGTTDRVHFYDDVFSWHNINGQDGEKLLPAILVTDRNPHEFKESFGEHSNASNRKKDFKIVLFSLKKYCKTPTEVAEYVERIFRDVVGRKELKDFRVAREMKKGLRKALVDGILL